MKIKLQTDDKRLAEGTRELAAVLGITCGEDGIPVEASPRSEGLMVARQADSCVIQYHRACEYYRALGLLVQGLRQGGDFTCQETPAFQSLGVMLDCSRNAVLTVDSIKRLIRHLALMGYDTLMLYTEDTYELADYPYFGYMRGRFSAEEIRECDAYAAMFGIELVPCIQTLAHLGSALRWPAFEDMVDFGDILLVEEEKTYAFIDAMLKAQAEMFTSRRINIGMDEAYFLGRGKYLDRHPYTPRTELLMNHLHRVMELLRKYGFQPMMWSDMFTHGTDGASDIHMPPELTLIYWDYYSVQKENYVKKIQQHKALSDTVMFAGGAWKWTGFAPGNQFSFQAGRAALEACLEHHVPQAMVTAWGDDGAECASFAILPVLQLYAEGSYENNLTDAHIRQRLQVCANACLEDFMALDLPNLIPGNEAPGGCYINPSKYLFYQDLLMGLYDRHLSIGEYDDHFQKALEALETGARRNPDWRYIFENLSNFCRVLARKYDMGLRIKAAYDQRDTETLRHIQRAEIPALLEAVETFYHSLEKQWQTENKIFGFDVQDLRLGGMMGRIRAVSARLERFLSGEVNRLEELEQERLYFDGRADGQPPTPIPVYGWRSAVTVGNF